MAFSKKQREEVYGKYNNKCAYCGCDITLKQMQVDHIIPRIDFQQHINSKINVPHFLLHLTDNDVNHIDNLNPACPVCNKWKSFHTLELFRSEISEQLNRLNERSANYRMAKRYNLLEETPREIVFYFEKNNYI